ncbi:MAG: MBOAT family protein [Polyangiaceae bacterium]|nr:MBOAT family protein [Polyangiaceae bacterium]
MLFNTLAYAQFFAIVFAISWALLRRQYAIVLPWLGTLGFALTHASLSNLGLASIAGLFTLALYRLNSQATTTATAGEASSGSSVEPGSLRIAATQVILQILALSMMTWPATGLDGVNFGLSTLGLPVHEWGTYRYILTVLGLIALVGVIHARRVRLLFLLGASYFFYAHWDWRFLPLIWFSSTADWWLARKIDVAANPRRRKQWLIATVVMNLGILGFFKYYNFGINVASDLISGLGGSPITSALHVALPVGISFFTFESMSYVIDVYRKELKPQKNYFEYLCFVAFFPHLVAGPIVRPKDLLPQLSRPSSYHPLQASEGLFLIAVGLIKKVAISDYLALNLVDRVFDAPQMYSSVEVYAGVIGYALQIYCDFSGYTDIAIGSALLLGVRFPLNFRSPYKANNIVDFWRRWHISLSTWLRDYLYIPLGGNRKGQLRTYFNLFITMLLGGLWHGASWTFVVWGALHGLALGINRFWAEWRKSHKERRIVSSTTPPEKRRLLNGLGLVASVLLTFHFVCICWVFFRAESFSKAELVFSQLGALSSHTPNLPQQLVIVLAVGLIGHYIPERLFETLKSKFCNAHFLIQGILLYGIAVALRHLASTDEVPFVYFQF